MPAEELKAGVQLFVCLAHQPGGLSLENARNAAASWQGFDAMQP
jgi:hypothetical protein